MYSTQIVNIQLNEFDCAESELNWNMIIETLIAKNDKHSNSNSIMLSIE